MEIVCYQTRDWIQANYPEERKDDLMVAIIELDTLEVSFFARVKPSSLKKYLCK